jgi:hypothetical protein
VLTGEDWKIVEKNCMHYFKKRCVLYSRKLSIARITVPFLGLTLIALYICLPIRSVRDISLWQLKKVLRQEPYLESHTFYYVNHCK